MQNHNTSEYYSKAIKWRRNCGCRTVHVCIETCTIAACWAEMLNHKWGTEEKKSNLTLHLHVHVQIPQLHQLDKIRNICLLLFHIAVLRSSLTLKCQLSHPSLLSSCGSSVAAPLFKATINEARPVLGMWKLFLTSMCSDPLFLCTIRGTIQALKKGIYVLISDKSVSLLNYTLSPALPGLPSLCLQLMGAVWVQLWDI